MTADQIAQQIFSPAFLVALLVGLAVFATILTVVPSFGGDELKGRMKSVALERDELRARQRAQLAAENDSRRRGLREQDVAEVLSALGQHADLVVLRLLRQHRQQLEQAR